MDTTPFKVQYSERAAQDLNLSNKSPLDSVNLNPHTFFHT